MNDPTEVRVSRESRIAEGLRSGDQSGVLVIITGMSGSGKHTAFKAFEDLGYFCVDNLPTPLIPRLIEMMAASDGKIDKLAIVVDVRLRESITGFEKLFREFKEFRLRTTVIFFEASNEALVRRYSETRRIHPLAHGTSLLEGVQAERRQLAGLRALADLVVDTTDLTVHDLRNQIYQDFREVDPEEQLHLSVVSFGFKHGLPYNSDLVFDVRFLPNPNFVEELKPLSGNDPEVIRYMEDCRETAEIIERIHAMLEYLIPKYIQEGKSYLTVSIGCTGGRHRSVMVANELRTRLERNRHKVTVSHRDLNVP